MRMSPPMIVAALALVFAGEAAAQNPTIIDATKQPSPLRYRFTHLGDGVMRLDHQTGQLVFCKLQAGGKWQCNAVPEDGAVLKAQLAQAENDNSKLGEQLGELQKQLNIPAEERAALKAAIDKAQADSAAAKSELAALREEIAALRQQLSSNQAEKAPPTPADNDNGKLSEQLGEIQKQLNIPAEERAALKAAIDQAQADSAAAKSELAALREEIAALKQQSSSNKAEQALRGDVAQIRTGNEALAAELAAMRKDIAAIGVKVAAQTEAEAQRAEIAKLKSENGDLKDRVAALQDATAVMQKRIAELEPPRPPASVPAPGATEPKSQVPSKDELAQARAKIVDAWRSVVEMLNNLRRDLTRKNDDSVRL